MNNRRKLFNNDDPSATSCISLLKVIYAKDYNTGRHSLRVTGFADKAARQMGLSQEKVNLIRLGSLLHDIGKIGITNRIIQKPSKLNREEYDEMKRHPQIGARLLSNVRILQSIVPMVLYHHECYDGKGYPYGLKGKEIPEEARIISVADAFEAMTANRPYRQAFSRARALYELQRNSGTQFDPEIVDVFIHIWGRT